MSARDSAQQIHFLSLQTAIFCVQCELISANTTPSCLACGSKAVLGLSRLLGGSLRGHSSAHLIEDDELNRIVRDLLHTVPNEEGVHPVRLNAPSRHHARRQPTGYVAQLPVPEIEFEPAIGAITERAQVLTGASGAAIALRKGNEIICRARAGRTAPDLGVRLQTDSGISAECMRTGEVVLCNDAAANPHIDRAICERLGVRSILAAPLRQFQSTLGIFEVLSSTPNAFNHEDIAMMQMLSGMMVAAITCISHRPSSSKRPA